MITGIGGSTDETDGPTRIVIVSDTKTDVYMVLSSTTPGHDWNVKHKPHHERRTVQGIHAAESRTPRH